MTSKMGLGVLAPLTLLYRAGVLSRNLAYRFGIRGTDRLPGVTLSVGNLVAGGTGKSPVVIELARYLLSKGHAPAILTRGYRSGLGKDDSMVLVDGHPALPPLQKQYKDVHADEARMQSNLVAGIPVIVGARRFAAAERFLAAADFLRPTHWILDDGFQHVQIERQLNIVLLDGESPFGDERLLPAGKLREMPSALARADAIVFTRAVEGSVRETALGTCRRYSAAPHFFASVVMHEPWTVTGQMPEKLDGKILMLTAIARPERFRQDLKKRGLKPSHELVLRDHSRFSWQTLRKDLRECPVVVTTEKDYWRDPEMMHNIPALVVVFPIRAQLDGSFFKFLDERLASISAAELPK